MRRLLSALAAACLLFTCAGSCGNGKEPASSFKAEFTAIEGIFDRVVEASNVEPIIIPFTSSAFWKVSTPSWIHHSLDYGIAGTYEMKLTVDANPDYAERSGTVQFICSEDIRSFTVKQNAKEPEKPQDKSFSFRLMSFNILQSKDEGEGHTWAEYRQAPCQEMFTATDPDIICLQECRRTQLNFMKDRFPQYSYFQYAKDGVKVAGYENVEKCDDDAIFQNGGHRDVIALRTSRFAMLDWGRFWFSETPDVSSYAGDLFIDGGTPKLTLWLKVRELATGVVFYVWTTHFFPSGVTGRLQCGIMSAQRMQAECPDNAPVFFCGDLNVTYEHDALKPIRDYMQSAGKTATTTNYQATYTGFRTDPNTWTYIDHIFYRNATADTYKVVQEPLANGTSVCSDHFPIYADFTVKQSD